MWLCKVVKRDFRFSAAAFFAMGGIALAIAGILVLTANNIDNFRTQQLIMAVSMLSFMALGLAAIVQIFMFFRRSLFSKAGYLAFTLPVGRGVLLASKLIVSMIWFLYALAVTFVIIVIAALGADATFSEFASFFDGWLLVQIVRLVQIAFFAICLMFACVALSNSVFAGKRVHGILSGFGGIVYGGLFFWIFNSFEGRSWAMQRFSTNLSGQPSVWYGRRPLLGLRYGRIPIRPGDPLSEFIDIFQIGLTLGMAAIIIGATYYLLKRRVALS